MNKKIICIETHADLFSIESNLKKTLEKSESLPHHEDLKKIGQSWQEHKKQDILANQELLGITPSDSLLKFTLDDHFNTAAKKAFFRLWKNKNIYRRYAMASYCPTLKSIISPSDIEVRKFAAGTDQFYRLPTTGEKVEVAALHFISFPVVDSKVDDVADIEISTERPELILGATAIAVNPDSGPEQLKDLVGKYVLNPLTDLELPIIRDLSAQQPRMVVPLHNRQDFELVKNQSKATLNISIFDPMGNVSLSESEDTKVLRSKGIEVNGLTRFQARERIIAALEAVGIYRGYKEIDTELKICKITGDVVEDIATDQWFFRAEEYAQDLKKILFAEQTDKNEEYHLTVTPKSKKEELANHLGTIQDWPISRQNWWGQTLPVYELLSVDGGKTVGREVKYNLVMRENGFINGPATFLARNSLKNLEENLREFKKFSTKDPDMYRYDMWMSDQFFQENDEIWFSGEDSHEARKEAAEALRQASSNQGFALFKHQHNVIDNIEVMQDLDVFDHEFVEAISNFASLGWPTHQDSTGLLAPFKRRFPTDAMTFSEADFLREASQSLILSLALTNRLPASRFIVYNDVQDFSLKSGNVFLQPDSLIYGTEQVEDLYQGLEESSEIDDQRQENLKKRLSGKFPNGFESSSADALRLCLLSGRTTLSLREEGNEAHWTGVGQPFTWSGSSSGLGCGR